MKTHEVKSWPEFFEAVFNGSKKFDLRKNDRNYAVGDTLYLREFDDLKGKYTGRSTKRLITYVLDGIGQGAIAPYHGLIRGYAILSLGVIE